MPNVELLPKIIRYEFASGKTLIWWGLNFCRNNLTPIANYDKHKKKTSGENYFC